VTLSLSLAFLLRLTVLPALAHGDRFSLSTLSISPDDPDSWWGNANGWGVVHTVDAGANWVWQCEEGLGTQSVNDVLAWEDGAALLATADGVLLVGPSCARSTLSGVPEGAVVTAFARGEGVAFAAVYSEGAGGVYRCDPAEGCTATSLQGLYIKSIRASSDGSTVWATTVDPLSLAAALWVSDDGDTFTVVQEWPAGDVDVRLLHADAERLMVWKLPRSDAAVPTLLFSADDGASFAAVYSDGTYTDPVPGLLVSGNNVWLGSELGRTWRSLDGGRHFFESSETDPAVRCGDARGAQVLACTDHFADGFDIAVWQGGTDWEPRGCLDSAVPESCAADTCGLYQDAFVSAGAYGGGLCYTEPDPPAGCGTAQDASLIPLLLWGARRRRVKGAG
jgi:hypothetical protein